MKHPIILLIFLLIPLAFAETTFFDSPDDAFIMGDSATTSSTGGVVEGTTGGTIGRGGCLTNWSCSSWSSCTDGIQIRNCTKEKAYCYADLKIKPVENQSCFVETKNNAGFEDNGNLTSPPQINFKNIVLIFIALIIIIGIAVFFAHKKHKKRKYYSFGY